VTVTSFCRTTVTSAMLEVCYVAVALRIESYIIMLANCWV